MGVPGLFKLCEFEEFSSKIKDLLDQKLTKVAVDMYVILHKFCIDEKIATLLVNTPGLYCKELYEKIKNWLINFINQGFDLFLVYDGNKMKYKITEEDRANYRLGAYLRGDMIAAVEIVPEQMYNLQHYIADLNLPFIVAPFEADAELAYLFKQNKVDMVLTNDSDLIIYGVTRIIYIKPSKSALDWYEHVKIDEKKVPKSINELPLEWLWMFGYFVGCDYFRGVKGIGPQKAFAMITRLKREMKWDEIFTVVNKAPEMKKIIQKIPAVCELEYKQKFDHVRFVYTHQPIIVPDTYELRYLTNEEIPAEKKEEFGKVFDVEKQAKGLLHPIDNKEFQLIEI